MQLKNCGFKKIVLSLFWRVRIVIVVIWRGSLLIVCRVSSSQLGIFKANISTRSLQKEYEKYCVDRARLASQQSKKMSWASFVCVLSSALRDVSGDSSRATGVVVVIQLDLRCATNSANMAKLIVLVGLFLHPTLKRYRRKTWESNSTAGKV